MSDESLTISFTTDRTPDEAFAAANDDQCSPAWNFYVGTSLRDRIAAGPA